MPLSLCNIILQNFKFCFIPVGNTISAHPPWNRNNYLEYVLFLYKYY